MQLTKHALKHNSEVLDPQGCFLTLREGVGNTETPTNDT